MCIELANCVARAIWGRGSWFHLVGCVAHETDSVAHLHWS